MHDHDHDHEAASCCCDSLQALAHAASVIHKEKCCRASCEDGGDCCGQSIGLVLEAMSLHIDCLRKSCGPKVC